MIFFAFDLYQYIFGPLLFLLSAFIILIILLQRGRGGGLAGALGGAGGSSALGVKAGDIFTRITAYSVVAWIVLCAFVCWFFLPETPLIESDPTTSAASLTVGPKDGSSNAPNKTALPEPTENEEIKNLIGGESLVPKPGALEFPEPSNAPEKSIPEQPKTENPTSSAPVTEPSASGTEPSAPGTEPSAPGSESPASGTDTPKLEPSAETPSGSNGVSPASGDGPKNESGGSSE